MMSAKVLLALFIGIVLAVAGLALLVWLLRWLWTHGERDREPPVVEFELEPEAGREPGLGREPERFSAAVEEVAPATPTVGGPEAISPEVSEPTLEPLAEVEPVVEPAVEIETWPVEEEPFPVGSEDVDITAPQDVIVEEPAARAPLAGAGDDLKLIEGIGPKIASVLQAAGIQTFAQLAATDEDRLEAILREADPRLLRLAVPRTWPEQARLAAAGEWGALTQMQKGLRGGRESRPAL